jgi:hypothetical protein
MYKKALTLLEIIVSIIILSVTMIGLANIFISGKRHILHVRARMGGGELGKFFLDPLQAEVREDTWDTAGNNLTLGSHPPATQPVNNIIYTSNYTVSGIGGSLRRVVANITWNEIQP